MRSIETFTSGAPQRVDITAIERSLTALWKEAATPVEGETTAVTRACLLNLVVWSSGSAEDRSLSDLIARVVTHHPARILMVEIDESAPEGTLEAFISAHCHRPTPAARQVCSEQVTLRASADSVAHVPGLAEALAVTDLPVLLFAPGDPPFAEPIFRRLVSGADKVIVDSAEFAGAGTLRAFASLVSSLRRAAAGDLNWGRVRGFQDLVAGFFDTSHFRAQIPRISSVEISGGPGTESAARLLGGWIAAALERRAIEFNHALDPALAAGFLRSVIMRSPDGPTAADFVVEADAATGILTARVIIEGTCPLPRRARPRSLDTAHLLCGQIESMGRDPLYEAALAGAAALSV